MARSLTEDGNEDTSLSFSHRASGGDVLISSEYPFTYKGQPSTPNPSGGHYLVIEKDLSE